MELSDRLHGNDKGATDCDIRIELRDWRITDGIKITY